MAYCTEAQVQALMSTFQISASSSPSIDDVAVIIAMISSELDSALSSQAVIVPVDAPDHWVSSLSHLAALGVAGHILMSAFPSVNGPGSSAQGQTFWKAYQDGLIAYRKGNGIPADAVIAPATSSSVLSFFTDINAVGNVDAVDASGFRINAEPAFTREMVF